VLLTGAGGSIGSELARIVARFGPARLVLVERGENALFEIDREIARLFPRLPRAAVLHDVTDGPRTLAVVMAQKPDVIFHAAAHKHVPMMEDHPSAAIENNFYGTRSIADAACRVGVGRFVMISTDKAVNPTSVMGATKRLAELYIQHLSSRCETVFSMVRFGNVLGSACSVLPIWAKQLAQGEALTVTDAQMTRYFMTIPEAAGLVLQSAAYAGGNDAAVFLLDMGKPIRIVDMARRFIRAQGLKPEVDVPIVFTGVRPGEKLFEELAYGSEDMLPTPHASIRIWRTTPPSPQRMKRILAAFDALRAKRCDHDHHWQHAGGDALIAALRDAVPEMQRPPAPARGSAAPAPTTAA
jgi:FlaA1/EpsC-like NDP-sugar epimerase